MYIFLLYFFLKIDRNYNGTEYLHWRKQKSQNQLTSLRPLPSLKLMFYLMEEINIGFHRLTLARTADKFKAVTVNTWLNLQV